MSIASEISRLMGDSLAIAQAIEAKGVTVPQGSGFDDYADLIGQISGSTPFPFTKLSYLQTNGSNYILIPITYSSSHLYTIEMKVNIISGSAGYGTGWNAGGGVFSYGTTYGNGSSQFSPKVNLNNVIHVVYVIGNGTTTYTVIKDGATSTGSRSNSSLSNYVGSGYPVGVTTSSGGSVPNKGVSMKLYELTILQDSELVFNGAPVISTSATLNDRGQTVAAGTVGLYDLVTKQFYTNRASGTDFTPGY